MTPQQALQVLRDATEPANITRISRAGYVAIDMALQVLQELVEQKAAKNDEE